MTRIGAKLRELRLYWGLTQQQIGEQAGIPPLCIDYYESGLQKPQWRSIQRLAEVLHADPDLLANLAGVVPDDIAAAIRESPQRVKDVRRFLGLTTGTR
jgi:transcriptional regulator with XRE-family HTH domain